MIDIYKIGNTPEELQKALIQLRQDFDAHNHDGTSSKSFQTLRAETISARTILIRKTSYNDTASGIWMGLVGNVMKMKLGSSTAFLEWNGTALNITGSITGSTITGGTFRTATSGQRIVIASNDNTLRFYDDTGQVIGLGTTAAVAEIITLNATTTNGVRVNSSTANDVGFEFNSTGNYDSTGVNLQFTGVTNSATAININHDGSSGEGIYVDTSAGARAIQINNTGSGTALYITNSGAGSIYINHTTDASIGLEIDYSGRVQGFSITGSDASSNQALIYATSNHSDTSIPTVLFNRSSNAGSVLSLTTSINSSFNYPTGLKISINNSGSSQEVAFEFAGGEYISSATGVSGLTGVIKVVTSDGLCYIPIYSSYS